MAFFFVMLQLKVGLICYPVKFNSFVPLLVLPSALIHVTSVLFHHFELQSLTKFVGTKSENHSFVMPICKTHPQRMIPSPILVSMLVFPATEKRNLVLRHCTGVRGCYQLSALILFQQFCRVILSMIVVHQIFRLR